MIELLLPALILMLIGQLIHQIVKLKRVYQKFNSAFSLKKYLGDNWFIILVNMFLIFLIAIANLFVGVIVGPLAFLLSGFFVDNTVNSIFRKPNGIK
jgi:hypothetical protein